MVYVRTPYVYECKGRIQGSENQPCEPCTGCVQIGRRGKTSKSRVSTMHPSLDISSRCLDFSMVCSSRVSWYAGELQSRLILEDSGDWCDEWRMSQCRLACSHESPLASKLKESSIYLLVPSTATSTTRSLSFRSSVYQLSLPIGSRAFPLEPTRHIVRSAVCEHLKQLSHDRRIFAADVVQQSCNIRQSSPAFKPLRIRTSTRTLR